MNVKDFETKKRWLKALVLKIHYVNRLGVLKSALTLCDILADICYSDNYKFRCFYEGNDRLVISKGHAMTAVYAVLIDKGILPEEAISQIGNGRMPRYMTRGKHIDFASASLGHGLGVAVGMAYADKMNDKDTRTVCVLGDAEIQEGAIWEAENFKSASNHCNGYPDLNLFSYIDGNKMSSIDIIDDAYYIYEGVFSYHVDRVLTKTGISFMENDPLWHYRILDKTDYEKALEELGYKL